MITGSGGQLSVDDPISYTDSHSSRDPDMGLKVFAQSGEALVPVRCCVILWCFHSEVLLPENYEEHEDEEKKTKTKKNRLSAMLAWIQESGPLLVEGQFLVTAGNAHIRHFW